MQSSSPSQSPSNNQQGLELEQQPHVVSSVFPDQSHPVNESVKKDKLGARSECES